MSSVKVLASYDEYKQAIATDKGAVIDFHAEWCGPCKLISPKFEAFSKQYSNLSYYSVDVDALPDVAEECGIQAMPTFQAFRSGEKVGAMKGAVPAKLEELLKEQNEKAAA